jgi:hypothetical protein
MIPAMSFLLEMCLAAGGICLGLAINLLLLNITVAVMSIMVAEPYGRDWAGFGEV